MENNTSFGAIDKTVEGILRENVVYVVPKFQRDYSWSEEEINELWEDLIDTMRRGDTHFLGALIFKEDSNINEIIDGQQRLATLTILLASIRDFYTELGYSELASSIQASYIQVDLDPLTLQSKGKIELNEHDADFFKRFVQNTNLNFESKENEFRSNITDFSESNRLIFDNYKFFREKIKEEIDRISNNDEKKNWLGLLQNCILKQVRVISAKVKEEEKAIQLFETLNARGLQLSVADLFKNYLFLRTVDDIESKKRINKEWNEMFLYLENSGTPIEQFLRHYLLSWYNVVRKKELYRTLKNIVQRQNVIDFVVKLKKAANIYGNLVDPKSRYWRNREIIELLKEIKMLNVKQVYPLLLSAKGRLNEFQFTKLLRGCFTFSFRYSTICKKNPNRLETFYSEIARDLFSNDRIRLASEIIERFRQLDPTSDEFNLKFSNTSIKKSKLATYILTKINDFLIEQSTGTLELATSTTPRGINLEHILPKSWFENAQWIEYIRIKRMDAVELLHRIGNLTILDPDLNIGAQNSFFHKKRDDYYISSQLPINGNLKEIIEWDTQAIADRQEWLADIASQIWEL